MRQRFGDDWARIAKLSIIEETATGEKTVRCSLCQEDGRGLSFLPDPALTLTEEELRANNLVLQIFASFVLPGTCRCAWHTWRSLPPSASTAWPRSTLVST